MIFRLFPAGLIGSLVLGTGAGIARADEPTPPPVPVVFDLTLKGSLGEEPAAVGFDGASIRDNLKGIVDRIAKTSASSVAAIKRVAHAAWNRPPSDVDALEERTFPQLFGPEQSARMHSFLAAQGPPK